ncbi:NAD(P)-dependent dehydrogenase (short-subunit alcohol dehydrogenase family) [Breoghania corrubedonensis]|uniref:NAD(P)-dependent dehydrogenase (Short-subunit alcohol dehydrogenase family) n=1 Tax=Breoghania corrubedonensis TaxID=665038 RepID=A0A2T5US66_9HYPH|nr:SDR family oxidoreductase [Breoghania corrubedonensis]PTW54364.1 NAD(P)-dependent dehydrogenase (short-subunit alcohol dehydrogenase family) [Breoghania corrubedonensis]
MAQAVNESPPSAALVTGAASGIGRAIAALLHERGWQVFICDADPEAVRRFQADLPGIEAVVCNIADPENAKAAVAAVLEKTGGRIELLVNNAGIAGMTGPVEDIDPDDWRRTLDVNVNGTFYFLHEIVPAMKRAGRGVILNIASTAALFGYPNRTPYAASKWAIVGLTKTLAMELGPFGIRVNAICPGSVEGPRIEGVIARDAAKRGTTPEAVRHIYESQVSMRSFVSADDIARMCAFLASEEARLVSGQIVAVDGHTESLSVPL